MCSCDFELPFNVRPWSRKLALPAEVAVYQPMRLQSGRRARRPQRPAAGSGHRLRGCANACVSETVQEGSRNVFGSNLVTFLNHFGK